MRWGRRKKKPSPPPASSPGPSLLSSLILRFKKMGVSSNNGRRRTGDLLDYKPGKVKQTRARAEVYGRDEAFWKLSFRKDKLDLVLGAEEVEETTNFNRMVSGIRSSRKEGNFAEVKTSKIRRNRGNIGAGNSGTNPTRGCRDSEFSGAGSEEIDELFPNVVSDEERIGESKSDDHRKSEKQRRSLFVNRGKVGVESSGSSPERGRDSEFPAALFVETDELFPDVVSGEERSGESRSGDPKIGKQRRSMGGRNRGSPKRGPRQRCRVRVRSPELRKLKAVEKSKRAKSKRNGLERFAVAKCSFDPWKDFRDSMIEMILERRMSGPEELEELLACYLALNSDECHGVIVEVFRQIWFELRGGLCCEYENPEDEEEEW